MTRYRSGSGAGTRAPGTATVSSYRLAFDWARRFMPGGYVLELLVFDAEVVADAREVEQVREMAERE